MATTVVYAIGGTGAKLLEALVHLCAAGLVSEDLHLRLVDQDRSNGNTQRVGSLVGDYQIIRAWLRNGKIHKQIDDARLFHSRLVDGYDALQIILESDRTLAGVYNLGSDPGQGIGPDDLLIQALFSPRERSDPMMNGFRGRPSVGAAVFLSPVARNGNSPFWEALDADVAAARRGQIGRFLLLGSSFGGTGASGIPTIARYLRTALRKMPTPPRIGAALMLRYFKVTGESAYGPASLAQIRSALEFYEQELRARPRPLIDDIYLVGLAREIAVPAEAVGGGPGQANPALLPELLGALGAAHFLDRTASPDQEASVWICGHERPATVSWGDLPSTAPRQPGAGGSIARLCSFARFAFLYAYGLHATTRLSQVANAADLPMYFRFLDPARQKNRDYDDDAKSLFLFAQKFLRWFGALQATAQADDTGGTNVALGPFADLVAVANDHPDRFKLRFDPETLAELPAADLATLHQAFDAIEISVRADDFLGITDRMAKSRLTLGFPRGLPGFVGAAHSAAALR